MITLNKRRVRFFTLSFLKHDFKASITVFFVALPLCLGVALASTAPVYSGLVAGIIGGIVVSLMSGSQLSVSGPAAGLTAICAGAITELGSIEIFFLSVAVGGLLQFMLGILKLGGFTHFIPSAVIKGMLSAIGIILISKQIPLLIGYDKPDFWTNEFFNLITFRHVYESGDHILDKISEGALIIGAFAIVLMVVWEKYLVKKVPFLPTSFVVVIAGSLLAFLLNKFVPAFALESGLFVNVPHDAFGQIRLPDFHALFSKAAIWKNAVVICFVATLETLLSIEAIDKMDPNNRITPQNRELVAQGTANMLSGLIGGLPITAVIVRSAANAEAGARTMLSSFSHGIWLLLTVLFAAAYVNMIPYCVLAVILIRTGYNLAKPKMVIGVYRQGREQFMPFLVTVIAILFTDLLIGVLIGVVYAIYFIIKHTYRAGYTMTERKEGHIRHFTLDLALNVSFLNKKRLMEQLDKMPEYAIVEITGSRSVYIDHDILEIIHEFKSKAHNRHIQLILKDIPEMVFVEAH